jgi:hypothetical protein
MATVTRTVTRKTVCTVDEAAAAYGGMPELIKAFGLTMAKGRANSVERWQLAGVPRYYNLGLYLGLQHRGYEATPQLFGARTWEEVPGIPSGTPSDSG